MTINYSAKGIRRFSILSDQLISESLDSNEIDSVSVTLTISNGNPRRTVSMEIPMFAECANGLEEFLEHLITEDFDEDLHPLRKYTWRIRHAVEDGGYKDCDGIWNDIYNIISAAEIQGDKNLADVFANLAEVFPKATAKLFQLYAQIVAE